jgi:hypothetical protein
MMLRCYGAPGLGSATSCLLHHEAALLGTTHTCQIVAFLFTCGLQQRGVLLLSPAGLPAGPAHGL